MLASLLLALAALALGPVGVFVVAAVALALGRGRTARALASLADTDRRPPAAFLAPWIRRQSGVPFGKALGAPRGVVPL